MRRMRHIYAAILAVTLAGVTATQAQNTWTGLIDDSYNTAGNWSAGSVPDGNSTTNPYVLINNPAVNGTINYYDGETNSVRSTEWYGGMTLNQFGGYLNSTRSGNSVRDWVGKSATSATWNLTGGKYQSSHILRVGIGGEGTVNVDGGELLISRGGNGVFGNGTSVSLSLGSTTAGTVNMTDGTLQTRVGIEVGGMGVFNVQGAGSTISIGDNGGNGDGDWFQNSNGVLRVGISTNGVSPIVIVDETAAAGLPLVKLKAGSILDVGFIDGAMETNFWPVLDNTDGTWSNLGMVPAAGVDTNDWGFIISNNVLYVGYGLGWPFGEEVQGPPPSQRTLYWTAAAGDGDVANPTNWVLDLAATIIPNWGPYDDDFWRIADGNCLGVSTGVHYVVNYNDGDAVNTGHRGLNVGISDGIGSYQGTYNHNSGNLTFTSHTSSRQEFGLNPGGDGTLNMNAGTLNLNAGRFGVGGAKGTLNLNGGTLNFSRGYGDYSVWIGHNSGSAGIVNIAGGRTFIRGAIKLGDITGAAPSTFSVEGSAATDIIVGANGNTVDGGWYQWGGTVLKSRIDAGGITPITVVDKNDTNSVHNGNVHFNTGSTLDVDWVAGVTNYGDFLVMEWGGTLVESNLVFASSVDTNLWVMEFVDSGATTNGINQLWVTAISKVPSVVPNITSNDFATATLYWDSEPGFNYNVLSKGALTDPTWSTNVAAVPSAGATTSTNVVPSGGTEEFFKIEAYY